ncbi:MAG: hypothetical protein JNN27_15315 [Planctomycetes bacterium]|nr:hypothetical protein [Planctomycetota bacterium]
MSWFDSFEELERASRISPHCEVAPGVVVVRRTFVFGALAAGAALLGACQSAPARLVQLDNDEHALEDFVHALRPRARELIASAAPDEERYLAHVARSLARLAPPKVGVDDIAAGNWDMTSRCRFPPIAVFEMRLAAGARLELHDHRDYNGVLSCARGSVRCGNYDIVGDIAAARALEKDESFEVLKLAEVTLRPGDVSTLSRSARNLHELEAGRDGAVLYDAFTYFDTKARSYNVALGAALANAPDHFEAHWQRA